MDLRDEIALRVLPMVIERHLESLGYREQLKWETPAQTAYGIADAMIKVKEGNTQ